MKLNEISIFDGNLSLVISYEDNGSNFCTEEFEKDSVWYERIMAEYGNVEINKVGVNKCFHTSFAIYVDKETCFKISREIMGTRMVEDEELEETA